jgi:hypothetical protein
MINSDFSNFLNNNGFEYFEDEDEWRFHTYDGYLVIWEKPNNKSMWVLSEVDSDDYIYELINGYEYEIINQIKSIKRDTLIGELLSK